MNYRPILFNAEMVCAILARTKTQMRQPLKRQPPPGETSVSVGLYNPICVGADGVEYPGPEVFGAYSEDGEWACRLPWAPGDQLWVQEKWRCTGGGDRYGITYAVPSPNHAQTRPSYRQLGLDSLGRKWLLAERVEDWKRLVYETRISTGWRSSATMPRWASRIDLEVKRVWVEQAQDIPPIDTLAEGICLPEPRNVNTNEPPPEFPTWTKKRQEEWIEGQARAIYFCRCHDVENHIVAFHNLWDSTWAIKGFPWDDNPWVFAAEFSLIENTKARAES